MDPGISAALIGAVAVLAAAVVGIYFRRKGPLPYENLATGLRLGFYVTAYYNLNLLQRMSEVIIEGVSDSAVSKSKAIELAKYKPQAIEFQKYTASSVTRLLRQCQNLSSVLGVNFSNNFAGKAYPVYRTDVFGTMGRLPINVLVCLESRGGLG